MYQSGQRKLISTSSQHRWTKHEAECGGTFTKIAEPELTKHQTEKLSGLKRAGLQKNKIDTWATARQESTQGSQSKKRSLESDEGQRSATRTRSTVACPICDDEVDMNEMNSHLDKRHPS